MIVNKMDKTFQTRSDLPNSNWMGKGWHIVKDDSELARKISRLYPRYDLVLDEEGTLVDVKEIPYTANELNQKEIDKIDKELEQIDKSTGLTRILEDIITHTGIYLLMYDSTKEIIEKKKTLREKRNKLLKEMGGM